MSDYDSKGTGNISLEYGSGGRKIKIVPPDTGVVEGYGPTYPDAVSPAPTGK